MKKLITILILLISISCEQSRTESTERKQEEVKKEVTTTAPVEEEVFIKTATYTDKETGEVIVKILVPDNSDEKSIEDAMVKTLKIINREKKNPNYTIRVFGDENFWINWKHSDTHGYMVVENYEVRKNVTKPKKEIPTQDEKNLFITYDTLVNDLSDIDDVDEVLKKASTILSNKENISIEELDKIVDKVFKNYINMDK